jgi:7-cyano-7-deazaguanine synthase
LNKKAVILLSGGLDSATVFAIAKEEGFEIYAMSFRYGQRDTHELKCAEIITKTMTASDHKFINIDLGQFGGSALTDDIEVPKGRNTEGMVHEIPVTYVPARNTVFLSYALAWAEVIGCSDIFIGANAIDYSGYPDCRPEFIEAYERMANLATKSGAEGSDRIKINAPLIDLTKAQIIQKGLELGVDYSTTSSCYDPLSNGAPCCECDSCLLRAKGFAEVGIADPLNLKFGLF